MPLKVIEPRVLCQECRPSPGWGYHIEDDSPYHPNSKALPPAGNGWEHDGMCKNCDGVGVDKYGRVNAGREDMYGMGAWCEECKGTGKRVWPSEEDGFFHHNKDGNPLGKVTPCVHCCGTGRDEIPWSELFSNWMDDDR